MRNAALGIAAFLLVAPGWAQPAEGVHSGVVIGANRHLSAGAAALKRGAFDEAIHLTSLGLESRALDTSARAAGHANLCAAYVSSQQLDAAIAHCDESLRLDGSNWRPYTIRARAYLLKGMYARARLDNDAAAAISPEADHVRMIAGLLNEIQLEGRIVIEEQQ